MLKIVEELKQLIPFKETTDIGDIILIAAKEPQMLAYARVSGIERDSNRKDEWWHIHFTMLKYNKKCRFPSKCIVIHCFPIDQLLWNVYNNCSKVVYRLDDRKCSLFCSKLKTFLQTSIYA